MSWMERIPRVLWGSAAAAFLACGSVLPLIAWRLDLVHRIPAAFAGPTLGLAVVSAAAWLAVGSFCLSRSRRTRLHARAAERRIALGTLPHAHLR
jgi:hypothetical protein